MKYEMPAVTKERRAELVNLLINRHAIMAPDVDTKRMEENMEIVLDIALAAMTAEPKAWIVHAHGGDQLTDDGDYVANAEVMRNVIASPLYAANSVPALKPIELPEPYDDGHGNLWLPQDSVISSIRAAGYEVKE